MGEFSIKVSVGAAHQELIPSSGRFAEGDRSYAHFGSFYQISDELNKAAVACRLTGDVIPNGYRLGEYDQNVGRDDSSAVHVTATSTMLVVEAEGVQAVESVRKTWQAHMDGINRWLAGDHFARSARAEAPQPAKLD